jgi:hypothetical protein
MREEVEELGPGGELYVSSTMLGSVVDFIKITVLQGLRRRGWEQERKQESRCTPAATL